MNYLALYIYSRNALVVTFVLQYVFILVQTGWPFDLGTIVVPVTLLLAGVFYVTAAIALFVIVQGKIFSTRHATTADYLALVVVGLVIINVINNFLS